MNVYKEGFENRCALADYMSDLSEEAYFAGWMDGLEYALWEALMGVRTEYGYLTITPEHRSKLKRLSAACGGWVYWGEDGATFVTLEQWCALG